MNSASKLFQPHTLQEKEQLFTTSVESVRVLKKQTDQSDSSLREATCYDILHYMQTVANVSQELEQARLHKNKDIQLEAEV